MNPCFTCDKRSGCKKICYAKLEYNMFDKPDVVHEKERKKKRESIFKKYKKNDRYISNVSCDYSVEKDGLVIIG